MLWYGYDSSNRQPSKAMAKTFKFNVVKDSESSILLIDNIEGTASYEESTNNPATKDFF